MLQRHSREWSAFNFVLIIVVLFLGQARAAEPLLVVHLKSLNHALGGVNHILRECGAPQLAPLLEGVIFNFTKGKGLTGVDQARPLGFSVSLADTGTPEIVIFVPVTNRDSFLQLLGGFFPGIQTTGGDAFQFQGPAGPVHGRFSGKNCFMAQTPDGLVGARVPATALTSDLDLGVQMNLTRLSKEQREFWQGQFKGSLESGLKNLPMTSDLSRAKGREFGRTVVEETSSMLFRDCESLSFGLKINRSSSSLEFEWSIVARPGTPMAKFMARIGNTSPHFAALASQTSPASLVLSMPLSEEFRHALRQSLEPALEVAHNEVEASALYQSVPTRDAAHNDMESFLRSFEKMDQLDMAAILQMTPSGKPQVLLAFRVENAHEFNGFLEAAARLSRAGSDSEEIKLDVATMGNARIHELVLPGEVTQIFEMASAHMAVEDTDVFVAVGADSLRMVKSAMVKMRSPGMRVPPVSLTLRPGRLLKIFAPPGDPDLEALRKSLSGPGDLATFKMVPARRGVKSVLVLGKGFLRLLVSQATSKITGG